MENLRIKLKEVDGKLMMPVPRSIGKLMGWHDGDLLSVPFHKVDRIPMEEEYVESPEEIGQKQIKVKIGKHEPKIVKQEDVIELLENPTPDMKIYRTTYIKWKGKTYGVKNLWKELLGHEDFNTQTGERKIKALGFPTFKE
jgi:hypothetical protein